MLFLTSVNSLVRFMHMISCSKHFVQSEEQVKRASAMSTRVCPATTLNQMHGQQRAESACHITDSRADHRCFKDEDCGVESSNCRRRSCSMAGYCGQWLFM